MKVHHIALSVKDSEKSARFYKDHFGFQEIERFTKPGWDGSAIIIGLGDVRFEIFQCESRLERRDELSNLKVLGLKHIGIQVESVKGKYEELRKKKLDIDEPVKGTTCAWYCYLRDPDGIPIELYEPK